MIIRPYRSDDEEHLKAAYLKRFPGHLWRPLDGAYAVVVENDGMPVQVVAAHGVAEVRVALDSEWATPGIRRAALRQAYELLEAELQQAGYTRIVAALEPSIARGFGRRLKQVGGWFRSRCEFWERQI